MPSAIEDGWQQKVCARLLAVGCAGGLRTSFANALRKAVDEAWLCCLALCRAQQQCQRKLTGFVLTVAIRFTAGCCETAESFSMER
jgi:hypothetical protein